MRTLIAICLLVIAGGTPAIAADEVRETEWGSSGVTETSCGSLTMEFLTTISRDGATIVMNYYYDGELVAVESQVFADEQVKTYYGRVDGMWRSLSSGLVVSHEAGERLLRDGLRNAGGASAELLYRDCWGRFNQLAAEDAPEFTTEDLLEAIRKGMLEGALGGAMSWP